MATQIAGRQVADDTLDRDKLAEDVFLRDITTIDNTDSPYTLVEADEAVLVDTSGGPVTIILPTLSGLADGRQILIKDFSGDAATNNITIDPIGVETIDGSSTPVVLSTARAVFSLAKTPVGWFRVSSDGAVSISEVQLGVGAVATTGVMGMELKTMPVGVIDPTMASPIDTGAVATTGVMGMELKTMPTGVIDPTMASPIDTGAVATTGVYGMELKTMPTGVIDPTMASPIDTGAVATTSAYTDVP